jgi:hypothetical protein
MLDTLDHFKQFGRIVLQEYLYADRELAVLEAMDSPAVVSSVYSLGISSSANVVLYALLTSLLGRVWSLALDKDHRSASLYQCRRLLQRDGLVSQLRSEFSETDEASINIIDEDLGNSALASHLREDIAASRSLGLLTQFEQTIEVLRGDFLPSLLASNEAVLINRARSKVTAHNDIKIGDDGLIRLMVLSDFGLRHEDIRLLMTRIRKVVSEIFLISNRGHFLLEVSEIRHRKEASEFWSSFEHAASNCNQALD